MLICRPSNIVTGRYVSLGLASGTEDPAYPLTALIDQTNPAKGFRATDAPVVALRVVWDHGEDLRIDAVSLAKSNLAANLDVRVQRHTANAWDAPTQNAALPIAAPHEDGHSASPWVDLRTVAGYRVEGYRYTSLYIPVNTACPRLAGLVFVQEFESLVRPIKWGLRLGERRPFIWSLQTEADVRRYYSRRLKQRYIRGDALGTDTDIPVWCRLARETDGPVRPFLLILDETLKTDNALLMRYSEATAAALEWTEMHPSAKPITLEFDEVSRGLPSF